MIPLITLQGEVMSATRGEGRVGAHVPLVISKLQTRVMGSAIVSRARVLSRCCTHQEDAEGGEDGDGIEQRLACELEVLAGRRGLRDVVRHDALLGEDLARGVVMEVGGKSRDLGAFVGNSLAHNKSRPAHPAPNSP